MKPRKSAKKKAPAKGTAKPKAKPRGVKAAIAGAKALAAPSNGKLRKPVRGGAAEIHDEDHEEGPAGWLLPDIEAAYTQLRPRGEPALADVAPASAEVPPGGVAYASVLQSGMGEEVFSLSLASTAWQDRLRAYKQRKASQALLSAPVMDSAEAGAPPAPFVPGGRNWLPLGPIVVLDGQTVGNNPVAGRTSGIAVAPGGTILYAATACGGVFRSNDAGTSWTSLMDGFDLNPVDYASASLACGAIAIDSTNPDRVYVGTGEGDTHTMLQRRIVNALPAYRGIGPIRSDDGGKNWVTEATAAGSPTLAGEAFFALAVDPRNRENLVAATTGGLYQRVMSSTGAPAPEWVRRRPGVHCSVVVAASGSVTRFFAAQWGGGVLHSTDGITWADAGTGLPAGMGRIALAIQPTNPGVLYAFIANTGGALLGLFRLDGIGTAWKRVLNPPQVLPSPQGDYDLAIVIDPVNVNLVYLGGSYANMQPWPGSVWRCIIQAQGAQYSVNTSASIGTHAHADVHVLVHTPGNPNVLWCGCDGGVFVNRDPRNSGEFSSQNTGLACLCSNFIAQHPTDPGVLFTGLQDNGTARTGGDPVWRHVNYGDGGYCVINWADPNKVLVFANGTVYRSTTGGKSHNSWGQSWKFNWATMTQPICTPSYDPASPEHADIVAVAAGLQVSVSDDFAGSWPNDGGFMLPSGSGDVFAMNFASATRIFVGTTKGRVFRADRNAEDVWMVTRIDDTTTAPLGLVGLITDVAIDWSDSTRSSVYVSFGGSGSNQRVWWYDGTNPHWVVRSGSTGANLLDVEHNALTVDPVAPMNLYAGADIGVWHSADRGLTWQPMENGLPDAPVFDLQIHSSQRLLRAATHGRGVYEISLS